VSNNTNILYTAVGCSSYVYTCCL